MIAKHNIIDHVYFYINSRSAKNPIKISDLTKNSIYKAIEKEGTNKKDIDEALNKLIKDGSLETKHLRYKIYIPQERVVNLAPEDRRQIAPPEIWKLGLGLYILMNVVIFVPTLPGQIINIFKINDVQNAFLIFVLLGVVFSYITGFLLYKFLLKLKEKIPTVRKYQDLILPFFMFFVPISIVYGVAIYTLKEKITTTAVLSIIGISVAGQVGYWYIKKPK